MLRNGISISATQPSAVTRVLTSQIQSHSISGRFPARTIPSPLDPPAAIPKKYPSVPRANGSITILSRSSPEPVESLLRSLAKTFVGVWSKHLTPRYKASSVRISKTSVRSDASFPSRGSTCPKFLITFASIHSFSFKTPSITGLSLIC